MTNLTAIEINSKYRFGEDASADVHLLDLAQKIGYANMDDLRYYYCVFVTAARIINEFKNCILEEQKNHTCERSVCNPISLMNCTHRNKSDMANLKEVFVCKYKRIH